MKEMEQVIVAIAVQKGKMNQSLTFSEGLQLVNDIITGTSCEGKVINFKRKKHCYDVNKAINRGNSGVKYWKKVLKRNQDQLATKRGVKFGQDCSQWCTYENFSKCTTSCMRLLRNQDTQKSYLMERQFRHHHYTKCSLV